MCGMIYEQQAAAALLMGTYMHEFIIYIGQQTVRTSSWLQPGPRMHIIEMQLHDTKITDTAVYFNLNLLMPYVQDGRQRNTRDIWSCQILTYVHPCMVHAIFFIATAPHTYKIYIFNSCTYSKCTKLQTYCMHELHMHAGNGKIVHTYARTYVHMVLALAYAYIVCIMQNTTLYYNRTLASSLLLVLLA